MSKSQAADRPTAINLIYRNLPDLSAGGGTLHSTSLQDGLLVTLFHLETGDYQSVNSRLGEVVVSLEPTVCTWIFFYFFSVCVGTMLVCMMVDFGKKLKKLVSQ